MTTNKTNTNSTDPGTKGNGSSATAQDFKSTKEASLDMARHAKEDLQNVAESMSKEGQQKFGNIKSFAGKYIKTMEKEIEQNPLKSVAIALGTGALISFLLRRG